MLKRVNELAGIKESETGLAPPALWDLAADKQALQSVFRGFLPFVHKLRTNNDILLVFKPGFYFQANNRYKLRDAPRSSMQTRTIRSTSST